MFLSNKRTKDLGYMREKLEAKTCAIGEAKVSLRQGEPTIRRFWRVLKRGESTCI